jgi:YfiH family protein
MTLPDVPDTFYWTDESWGPALRCRPLSDVAPHCFTTRGLDVSPTGPVEPLRAAIGARDVSMATQVHGHAVVVVTSGHDASARPEADALISNEAGRAVAVRAADCVPLLLADPVTGAVAAIHAGWRGTAAGAATAGLHAMGRQYGTRPDDVVAAIGPSIGPCCYQVGPELVDAFAAAGHERYLIQRWFASPPPPRGSRQPVPLRLDVAGANRDQLILAGVREERVHLSGLCTAMHLDVLTSYRVEREAAGRLAGVIAPGTPGRSA